MWQQLLDIEGWIFMNKLQQAFSKEKAFIAFITGGDPDLDTTEALIREMAEAGADIIEIGIPFSDPTAEGAVIQAANERALKAGCTVDKLFAMIGRVRKNVATPLVFLTYANPVFSYGKERFMKRCQALQIDGMIIPDLPFEEKEEFADVCTEHGVDLISMIAPTSKERITMIAREAKGFLYCVSSLGVTGVRTEIKTDIGEMVAIAKEASNIPCAVGFGISTPEQAAKMADISDGAIVGSAIVKLVEKHGKGCLPVVREYVKQMKQAVVCTR